ncbi:cytochrome C oxidase subunit IV family protein [Haloplanus pelagicus]|jgi:cytochrome c oxidase subunit 4|uniref:cytochrome C oxidase subunit IV family protein n=1 Tax=Haloplanus pelagicus TaxID=2949995 RepID=UPI00203DE1EE|nr:cytochrome C oxidase subunit IV family protein [Haloplanus sp. HW8-1]
MTRLKLYTAIYVVLFVSATVQVLVEGAGLPYGRAFALIMALSFVKAAVVAGYYQHLRWEPRSLTYLVGLGLLAALALTVASTYSIT